MMHLGEDYWQNRYVDQKTGWDLGTASLPIVEFFENFNDKNIKILIPGAGNAHEAVHLYNAGFRNIYILDIAEYPLEFVKKQLPNLPKSHFVHGNYFEHIGSYDLILEQTFFCALDPRFRESYVKKSHELLKENGEIVGLLFNFEEKRTEPPFGGSISEYRMLFESYFEIDIMDPCYNSMDSRKGKELFIKLRKI